MKSGQRWDLVVRGAACALFVALPSAAASRGSVVLLEVKVADVSPTPDAAAAAASLSASGKTARAWLAGHLEGLGYAVVEDARAESVLQSLGTGACADADCAARLANALGARRAVIARLIKVSTIVWFLEGMIVDAGEKRVLRREQLELKGDVAQLLPHATLSLARRLAAADPSPAEPGPAAPPHKQGLKPSRDHAPRRSDVSLCYTPPHFQQPTTFCDFPSSITRTREPPAISAPQVHRSRPSIGCRCRTVT